jgi:hypothetical protein
MRGLLATAALLIAVAPAASGTTKPRLAVVSPAPKLVLRGFSFRPRERVTVRLIGRTTTAAVVSASVTGGFRVSLAKPRPLACGRFVIRAAGSLGSLVVVRFGPPECNPPGEGANR